MNSSNGHFIEEEPSHSSFPNGWPNTSGKESSDLLKKRLIWRVCRVIPNVAWLEVPQNLHMRAGYVLGRDQFWHFATSHDPKGFILMFTIYLFLFILRWPDRSNSQLDSKDYSFHLCPVSCSGISMRSVPSNSTLRPYLVAQTSSPS